MGEYKNVLARKFTRETNYRIICDTDNLEDLENQWFEFNLHMTPRQQRLSDDKSIEIWGMTNQEHYETLRDKLIQDISDSVGDNEDLQTFSIDESAVHAIDRSEEVSYVDNPHNNADKFETDSNMHIIGKINGETASDKLRDLERQYGEFETLSNDQKRKSDDECRRLYGVSNLERYNKIKANLLARYAEEQEKSEQIKPSEDSHLEKTASVVSEGFVGLCNVNRTIRESKERKKVKRRLNDLPYFTPAEMIDMGVHGHDNYYSDRPDNSKLVTDIRVPLWFASYKDMCMDHIFEDYRKDWIDTLRNLYSDYEEIKESGDTERILSRKQSILDLGWNPEIPFTSENRQKATERVNNIIENTMVRDIFIDLDSVEVDEETPINESINKDEHHPVFLIFNKGKTPIVSSTISAVTKSEYTHASISFSPDLNETYSYVMNPKVFGLVRETLKSFGNTVISVYAFFVDDETMLNFKQRIHDFSSNRTQYDFTICLNKILGVDAKYTKSQYSQVCSTFVDNILKSGNVNIVGDTVIPAPSDLYNGAKKYPNKIIRVFEGIATKYNVDKIKSKLDVLYRSDIKHIHESAILSSGVYHRGIHTSEDDDFMLENIKGLEFGDSYYNIDNWESGKSNMIWITGLSGSGKTTIAKEIAKTYKAEYVELDNLQRAKMKNWDHTGSKLLDSFIEYKGGLVNVFPYVNDLDGFSWSDLVTDSRCADQFNELFEYIFEYVSEHKTERFVIEGVQIAFCSNRSNAVKMSKCPVIIKDANVVKAELRREKRLIKQGIDDKDNLIDVIKKATRNHVRWIKNKFYLDDLNYVKDFKSYMTEGTMLTEANLSDIAKKIKNHGKYKIPDPKVTYENIVLPTQLWDQNSNNPYLSNEDIVSIVFSPDNLRPLKSKPDRYVVYKVTYDNKVTIKVVEDLDRVYDYLKKNGKEDDLYIKAGSTVRMSVPGKYCYSESAVLTESKLPKGVTLRPATMKDYDNMVKWELESVDKEHAKDPKVINLIKEDVKKSIKITKMIMYNGETIGMITTDNLSPGSEYWYIGEIYIVKEHRGKGIGTALIKDEISRHSKIKLQVSKSNTSAQNLYKSLGFKVVDTDEKNKMHIMELHNESAVLTEVKRFPLEFDDSGNLTIYKCKMGNIAYGDEINESSKLLSSYRNVNNQEGIKYELARVWFIIQSIENRLKKKKLKDEEKIQLNRHRTTATNVFKTNLSYLMKLDNTFNFIEYYNSTPFSDNGVKITAATLRYSLLALKNFLGF